MKACGIVVEYNPLHNGHVYHINKSKEITSCDVLIAVMSPNWTQRGEPALVSKDIRTLAALKNGVDLVLELPFAFAVNSADYFALGSLKVLDALKISDIVFGSETGDTDEFKKRYENNEFMFPRVDELLEDYLDQGIGYPKARSMALQVVNDYYLETPNDILATAYVDVIKKNKMNINYHTIKRTSSYHDLSIENINCSSSAIRKALKEKQPINGLTPMEEELKTAHLHYLEDYFPLLRYKLLSSSKEQLRNIHLISEGIESLLIKNINIATSMKEFIKLCTSKRYSGARITRIICHILVNSDKNFISEVLNSKLPYIRILGSNSIGRKYLSSIRKELEIEILNRFKGKDNPLLQLERQASAIYLSTIDKELYLEELNKEITLFPINID